MSKAGVFEAKKKDGTVYYRSSVTYKGKHISLGSYADETSASDAYKVAVRVLGIRADMGNESGAEPEIDDYEECGTAVSFDKWVMLVNLRRSGIYCRNPILLENKFFRYYVDRHTVLLFDVDDLFYYMNHKIMKRGGRLFVADFGMQVGILSRYGIHSFAVKDRDYVFKNGDENDLRYSNIAVINRYFGVTRSGGEGRYAYTARIHINGDNIVGRYHSEEKAAIAYNKAVDVLEANGFKRPFYRNYIEGLSPIQYKTLYNTVKIRKRKYEIVPE
ncbi:MAG: hypothetical protein ILP10_06775 [Lachnospiraceae bacterium]|nr:hypothetical protein [Lachnospiraceae bacterium]